MENSLEFVLSRPDYITHIFTSDVDSMYSSLNQEFIYNAVSEEIAFVFHIHGARGIKVHIQPGNNNNGDSASFVTKRAPTYLHGEYTFKHLQALLHCAINTYYMSVGNANFKQLRGIPMGGAASPHLANLALVHLEKAYVTAHPDTAFQHNVWRYMDDFAIVNSPTFQDLYRDIYPEYSGVVLVPNVLPPDPSLLTQAHFLDMHIFVPVDAQEVHITLYDKRMNFPFTIHKFPHVSSNFCIQQTHGVFFSELVRIYRINTHFKGFLKNVSMLYLYCVQSRGFSPKRIYILIWKFIRRIEGRNRYGPMPAMTLFTTIIAAIFEALHGAVGMPDA